MAKTAAVRQVRRRAVTRVVVGAVLGALVLAACTGDGDGGGDGSGGDGSGPPSGETVVPDTEDASPSIRVATLNVLHGNELAGIECSADDQCHAPDRVQILGRHISATCPEVVTLQEVDTYMEELIRAAASGLCGGRYAVHLLADQEVTLGIDQQLVLSMLPVQSEQLLDLPAVPWAAHHLVLAAPWGPVDLVTTHLASGVNNPRCAEIACPPVCGPDDDTRTCGARQIIDHLESVGGAGVWVVTGDLNAEPGESGQQEFLDAGFRDPVTVARLPECATTQPTWCTSGRDALDLGDPAAVTSERIDFILVRSGTDCAVEPGPDDVHPFAHEPVEPVGSAGLVWASDHDGVALTIGCR